jgi:tripartite-type tricarboxylate transporter receptor subunit TctC
MKILVAVMLTCVPAMIAGPYAAAQGYPAKPVRMLVAFPAGGSADIVARVLAQKLSESVGQNFFVDNRPGAGGNLAFEALAKADADGYTILNSTPGIVINPSLYRKVNFKIDDFVAISLVGEAPLLIMAHPSLPANNIPELVKLAKSKPGAIRYASAGNGSSSHLASEVLRMMAGIDMLHVPYKGGGPALQDVIGGQVEITALPIAESMPLVRSKRVKALGQTGTKRSSVGPEIPTLEESGIKGYNVTTWYVVFAPAKLPRELVTRLYGDIDKVLKRADTQEKFKEVGVDIIGTNPEQAAAFVKTEFDKWAKAIQASGAKVD